jgi:hypothetical protein
MYYVRKKRFKVLNESIPYIVEHRFNGPDKKSASTLWFAFLHALWVLVAQPSVKEAKRNRKEVVVNLTMGPTSDSSHSRETKPVPN